MRPFIVLYRIWHDLGTDPSGYGTPGSICDHADDPWIYFVLLLEKDKKRASTIERIVDAFIFSLFLYWRIKLSLRDRILSKKYIHTSSELRH